MHIAVIMENMQTMHRLDCLTEAGSCTKKQDCKTYAFWQGLDNIINEYVDSKTLEDLIR